jgi:glutamine amidotransferase
MITIIDYGVGNINAFYNIYKNLGVEVAIAKKCNDILDASKLILPGVGHFDYAMNKFNESGMVETVTDLVMNKCIPVLGICVGMQMLATKSEEGKLPGLNWINAELKKIDTSLLKQSTRLPHMGWNNIIIKKNNPIFHEIVDSPRYYFLHSFYFDCNNNDDTIATSTYGNSFTCAVNHNNIFGVQFHPEKSHHFGIQLLKNFSNL